MGEQPNKIYSTTNYSMFKCSTWNRNPNDELRIGKVMKSIKEVGFIGSIIVNELYEVIDGQARLEACKRMNVPVRYMIVPGIGKKECLALNISQTNWSIVDYIKSYSSEGSISYTYLLKLIEAYGKDFKLKVIIHAITGKMDIGAKVIKEGRLECTSEDYDRAQNILRYLTPYIPIMSRIQGHNEFYFMALGYCYGDEEVDNDRLFKQITLRQASLIPVSTIQQALEQIEEIYNFHIRSKKVYIKTNYHKYLDGKYAWYTAKYGEKYKEVKNE